MPKRLLIRWLHVHALFHTSGTRATGGRAGVGAARGGGWGGGGIGVSLQFMEEVHSA